MNGILYLSLFGNLHLDDINVDSLDLLKLHHIIPHWDIEDWYFLNQWEIFRIHQCPSELLGKFHTFIDCWVEIYKLRLRITLCHLQEEREAIRRRSKT
jgi:hypothetical protein